LEISPADFSENPAENRLEGKRYEIGPNSKLVAALNLPLTAQSSKHSDCTGQHK
jgi:hypothetical protein